MIISRVELVQLDGCAIPGWRHCGHHSMAPAHLLLRCNQIPHADRAPGHLHQYFRLCQTDVQGKWNEGVLPVSIFEPRVQRSSCICTWTKSNFNGIRSHTELLPTYFHAFLHQRLVSSISARFPSPRDYLSCVRGCHGEVEGLKIQYSNHRIQVYGFIIGIRTTKLQAANSPLFGGCCIHIILK